MADTAFLDRYESLLQDGLVKVCMSSGLLDDSDIPESPDILAKWDGYIRDYVADAVSNFNEFPQTAVAWAGFLGLGVAHMWDKAFDLFRDASYSSYYGPRGYDDMDEHILQDLLGLDLDSDEAKKISANFSSLAMLTLGLIRHEGIEAQTETGFYVLTRSYTVLFRLGAAIALRRLGYRKIGLSPDKSL